MAGDKAPSKVVNNSKGFVFLLKSGWKGTFKVKRDSDHE